MYTSIEEFVDNLLLLIPVDGHKLDRKYRDMLSFTLSKHLEIPFIRCVILKSKIFRSAVTSLIEKYHEDEDHLQTTFNIVCGMYNLLANKQDKKDANNSYNPVAAQSTQGTLEWEATFSSEYAVENAVLLHDDKALWNALFYCWVYSSNYLLLPSSRILLRQRIDLCTAIVKLISAFYSASKSMKDGEIETSEIFEWRNSFMTVLKYTHENTILYKECQKADGIGLIWHLVNASFNLKFQPHDIVYFGKSIDFTFLNSCTGVGRVGHICNYFVHRCSGIVQKSNLRHISKLSESFIFHLARTLIIVKRENKLSLKGTEALQNIEKLLALYFAEIDHSYILLAWLGGGGNVYHSKVAPARVGSTINLLRSRNRTEGEVHVQNQEDFFGILCNTEKDYVVLCKWVVKRLGTLLHTHRSMRQDRKFQACLSAVQYMANGTFSVVEELVEDCQRTLSRLKPTKCQMTIEHHGLIISNGLIKNSTFRGKIAIKFRHKGRFLKERKHSYSKPAQLPCNSGNSVFAVLSPLKLSKNPSIHVPTRPKTAAVMTDRNE